MSSVCRIHNLQGFVPVIIAATDNGQWRLVYHYGKKYSSIVHCRSLRDPRDAAPVMKYGYRNNDTMKGEKEMHCLIYIYISLFIVPSRYADP